MDVVPLFVHELLHLQWVQLICHDSIHKAHYDMGLGRVDVMAQGEAAPTGKKACPPSRSSVIPPDTKLSQFAAFNYWFHSTTYFIMVSIVI